MYTFQDKMIKSEGNVEVCKCYRPVVDLKANLSRENIRYNGWFLLLVRNTDLYKYDTFNEDYIKLIC